MNLNPDDLKWLQDFMNRINTQDNRGTANPYYYTIMDYKWVEAPVGEGDRVIFLDEDWDEIDHDKVMTEDDLPAKFDPEAEEHQEDFIGKKLFQLDEFYLDELDITKMDQRQESFEKGFFFTEEAADNHLKANHYHYSSDAHTYVGYAFRNPELERLLTIVGRVAGEEYKRR